MPKTSLIKVSPTAVMSRIRRHHRKEGEGVRKNRRPDGSEPDFYVVNGNNHVIGGFDENALETYAREIGVLKPSEEIGSE